MARTPQEYEVIYPPTPVEDWGTDHWSTLAYLNCCYAAGAPIDHNRMRTHPLRHPFFQGHLVRLITPITPATQWKDSYGTRLKGSTQATPRQILFHDDWDCLEDIEHAGYCEVFSTMNGLFRLTDEGQRIANSLVLHKYEGGRFADFSISPALPTSG